ncbi:ATP-binding cassette domain-containing protein, partial [Klebsiella aerogenes]|uniref:ATP-binding cassette domain-containing protein n=2 Tax=Pseudomonadota TaxID=1224 RepID=UPI003D03EE16
KTSVLNMVAGLLRPDRGRIVVGGRVLFDAAAGTDLPPEARRAGYVFQEPRLFPHKRVRANLLYGAGEGAALEGVTAMLGIG